MRRRRGENQGVATHEPTRLDAIQPSFPGPVAGLLHAARRWRTLAGEELSRRLPLLDVEEGTWIIGLPSPAWESELARVRDSLVADGEDLPPLVGRIVARRRALPRAAGPRTEIVSPEGSSPVERMRRLMERMGGGDDA